MKDMDADYKHTKRVWGDFRTKNLIQDCDLYMQSDKLQLADVFESFQIKCIEIYGLDLVYFLLAPRFGMAGISEENKSWSRITTECWYITNGWKRC